LREDMALKAQAGGMELFFTENVSPLVKAGGVGSLLKFQISSRSRQQATP
jgi:hypothetical protein